MLTPAQLVAKAARLSMKAIGICDHDTVAGISEAVTVGQKHRVVIVPGVEVSADWQGSEYHFLGYYPDLTGPAVTEMLSRYQTSRRRQINGMIDRLEQIGIDMCACRQWQEGERSWGRPHLAHHLIRQGVVSSVAQAFREYLSPGGAAFVDRQRPCIGESITMLRRCGAVPVLAHIGSANTGIILEGKQFGLAGIEVYHPDHDYGTQVHLLTLAEEHDLLITGGSDYHGSSVGSHAELGSVRVSYDRVTKLQDRHRMLSGETTYRGSS